MTLRTAIELFGDHHPSGSVSAPFTPYRRMRPINGTAPLCSVKDVLYVHDGESQKPYDKSLW